MKLADFLPQLDDLIDAVIHLAGQRPQNAMTAWKFVSLSMENYGQLFKEVTFSAGAEISPEGQLAGIDVAVWFHTPVAWDGNGLRRSEGAALVVRDGLRIRTNAEAWEKAFQEAFAQLEERSCDFAEMASAWREREAITGSVPAAADPSRGPRRL
jgi:hypothetical protein